MSRVKTVSNCERKYILESLDDNRRLDGRQFDDFRNLSIQFGKDLGCCYVSLGKTRVFAQVSCEIQQPKSSRPSEGTLNINVELNPLGSLDFEPGRPSDLVVQLNRLLEKCLKDSKAVDLESLCIKTKEKVWALRVDLNVLSHEGNILDCASVAALAALAHFKRPDVTCEGEEFIIHSYKERDPIPTVIHHYPVCISYAIFQRGKHILADPNLLEESVAEADFTINVNSYKELCGIHLGGQAEIIPDIILNVASKAASRANVMIQQIKDSIEADTKIREKRIPVGFHQLIDSVSGDNDASVEINKLLDQSESGQCQNKKKRKKNKHKDEEENEEEKDEEPDESAEIRTFEDKSAELVPTDEVNPWTLDSGDAE